MLDWLKLHRVTILAIVGLLCVLWLAGLSESFQRCINAKQNTDAENSFYKSVSNVLVMGGVVRGCTGYFIDEAGNAITALATLLIALFTCTLWRTSTIQGGYTLEALRLSNIDLLSTHRPKIRVMGVGFKSGTTTSTEFQLAFTCINIGGTPCEIKDVRYAISAVEGAQPQKMGKFNVVKIDNSPLWLEAGQPTKFQTEIVSDYKALNLKGKFWDFFGYVSYEDKRGILRITGFWRRWDWEGERFTTPENPDFNYEY
jgi:hypothetical protein